MRYFPGGPQLAFLLLLIGILVLAFITVQDVLVPVLIAAAVASLTRSWHRALSGLLGGRPRLAAGFLLGLMLLVVLGPAFGLGYLGVRRITAETASVLADLPGLQSRLHALAERGGVLAPALHRVAASIGAPLTAMVPRVGARITDWASSVGNALAHFTVAGFLFCVTLYHGWQSGYAFTSRLVRLLPIEERHTRALLLRFHEVSRAVFIGNVGTAVLHGLLAGIGYALVRVDAALVWGIATGFASFIPVFGTALVWAPLSAALVLSGAWGRGLALLAYCTFVVSLSDNFARPLMMKRGLRIHPLLVFIAIFGGITRFGLRGLFLGPLVIALTVAVIDIYDPPPSAPVPLENPEPEGSSAHRRSRP